MHEPPARDRAPHPAFDVVVPPPDGGAVPDGFVVVVEPGDRIHFLDWGAPAGDAASRGTLLIHGIAQTAWIWTPVARRLRQARHTVAMDLRGHGLSDAPTTGYERETLADDVVAVAEGSRLTDGGPIVVAGHGMGAVVAAWSAVVLGPRCAGLVLVDGGWEDLRTATDLEPAEFLGTIEEPPEVLASMPAFLEDRRAFDPATWDEDQDRAARATVVETAAGRLVPVTRPHALRGSVDALFAYDPSDVLPRVAAPIVALVGAEDEAGTRRPALARVQTQLSAAGRPPIRAVSFPGAGHNLMRYRPVDVAAAILAVSEAATR